MISLFDLPRIELHTVSERILPVALIFQAPVQTGS
jgi:hypothetical protein